MVPGFLKYHSRSGSTDAEIYQLYERQTDWLVALQELLEESKAQATLRFRSMYGGRAAVADFNAPPHHLLAQIDYPIYTNSWWSRETFGQIPIHDITDLYDLSRMMFLYFPD